MSGRPSAGGCFNKVDDAAAKRHEIKHEVRIRHPTVVTINEGCSRDLERVAAHLGWQVRYQETANGRPCSDGRGNSVNAILARHFSSGYVTRGYFKGSKSRSYICSGVHRVTVCTAHLKSGLKARDVRQRDQQCRQLRSILNSRVHPTILGGDMNLHPYGVRGGHEMENCAPSTFGGISDAGASPRSYNLRGLQQIYYDKRTFELPGCGVTFKVPHTDHWGLMARLRVSLDGSTSPDSSGGDSGCIGSIRW